MRLLLALMLVALAQYASSSNPTAYTKDGYVQGFIQDGVNVFNRIPFAEAPVGQLRFKAPQAVASWNGTKDVSDLPPICPQLKIDGSIALSEDEDCLYLVGDPEVFQHNAGALHLLLFAARLHPKHCHSRRAITSNVLDFWRRMGSGEFLRLLPCFSGVNRFQLHTRRRATPLSLVGMMECTLPTSIMS